MEFTFVDKDSIKNNELDDLVEFNTVTFGGDIEDAPNFCAMSFLCAFCSEVEYGVISKLRPDSLRSHSKKDITKAVLDVSYDNCNHFRNLFSKEEAALVAIKLAVGEVASCLMLCDRVERGMHKHITPYLPDTFKHEGYVWRVEKRKPYVNTSSGNMVQEVAIYRVTSPKKGRKSGDM